MSRRGMDLVDRRRLMGWRRGRLSNYFVYSNLAPENARVENIGTVLGARDNPYPHCRIMIVKTACMFSQHYVTDTCSYSLAYPYRSNASLITLIEVLVRSCTRVSISDVGVFLRNASTRAWSWAQMSRKERLDLDGVEPLIRVWGATSCCISLPALQRRHLEYKGWSIN